MENGSAKGGSSVSFREMQTVPGELLEKRVAEVKLLESSLMDQYRIVKDEETGDHYLHYRYIHRDIAAGGAESAYHQLMPLATDDVLGIMFGEQPYHYPDAWRRPFLRNGPNDEYIWFDPAPALDADEDEREAARIRETLLAFKRKGSFGEEDVERLFRELDDHKPNESGGDGRE